MKKKILILLFAISCICVLQNVRATTTDTIGGTTATYDYFGAQQSHPVVASANGILTSVGMNIQTASGNIRLAIYSDNSSGKPSKLLGESESTVATTEWNDLAIPGGVNIVAATTYWLAYQQSTGACKIYRLNGETGIARRYYSHSYGVFDPEWLQADDGDTLNTLNMRIIYAPAPPPEITFRSNILFNWLKNKNKIWQVFVK